MTASSSSTLLPSSRMTLAKMAMATSSVTIVSSQGGQGRRAAPITLLTVISPHSSRSVLPSRSTRIRKVGSSTDWTPRPLSKNPVPATVRPARRY